MNTQPKPNRSSNHIQPHALGAVAMTVMLAGAGVAIMFWTLPPAEADSNLNQGIHSQHDTGLKRKHLDPATQTYCSPPLCLDWSSIESGGTSVAWGDYDGDGDLDLAVGNDNQPNHLYRNDNGTLTASIVWSSTESDSTYSVAWGDYDDDGDLDLVVGNSSQPNRLYRNDNGTLTASAIWSSTESDDTKSVAWGDYDGDGDLDLAVGNSDQPNRLYRNNNGTLTASAVYSTAESDDTKSVAWGDYDGDGDLDLAVGNWNQPNRLYRNNNGALTASAVYSTTESDYTWSVTWGDYDSDGDLDLAVGNYGQPNRLYRNNNGTLTPSAFYSTTESDYTYSVAWGDYDGDGDLDLAVGNIGGGFGQPNRLYRNDNGMLTASAVWSSTESDHTFNVAWGDYDGDGDLDLAVANDNQPNRLYRNEDGTLTTSAVYSTTESDNTQSVAWGDYDGDGDLDLAVGNSDQPNRLYRNDNGILTTSAVYSSTESDRTTSVAWGDYDGDGDVDLAVGNDGQPNRLYRNNNGSLTASAVYSTTESDNTYSVAWGDYDGDGDLDLAVGNIGIYDVGCNCYLGQPNRLYRNNNGTLTASTVWSTTESDSTFSVAWGDYDSDGDVDLAVGNDGQPNRLYRNDNGVLTPSAVWSSIESDDTRSVAWGDYDGDGDLDLAVGNYNQPNRLYRNEDGALMTSAIWSSIESDRTFSIAWGDYDGDGDLDLAVGNGNWSSAQPNRLYHNDNGTLTTSAAWSSSESDSTFNVAWGDYDGDGDLDLAVGNYNQPNRVYRNTRDGRPFPGSIPNPGLTQSNPLLNANFVYTNPALRTSTIPFTYTLSDPEGELVDSISAFYSPDGGGQWYPAVATSGTLTSNLVTSWLGYGMAFGGVVSDYVEINTSPFILTPPSATTVEFWMKSDDTTNSGTPVSYAVNGSDNELLIYNYKNFQIYIAGTPTISTNVSANDGQWHHIALTWRSSDGRTQLYKDGLQVFTATVATGQTIALGGTFIFGQEQDSVGGGFQNSQAFKGALDEVRVWTVERTPAQIQTSMATVLTGTQTGLVGYWRFREGQGNQANDWTSFNDYGLRMGGAAWALAAQPYAYTWDTFASGFYGQSDNVVFRIKVYPSPKPLTNSVPIFQRPYASATTFPFRVRGTQVRVISNTVPISNAIVYRLPATQTLGALPIADLAGNAYRTDGQGYLQGRGVINPNDQLIALAPIFITNTYGIYYTNISPTLTGLSAYTVTTSGVQTLTVSSSRPLVLFNLKVSLEWDARNDTAYLERLRFDLQRASEILFDYTNGQAALGNVTIYYDREQWINADIRIFANNQLRPYASIGGFGTQPITDPVTSTIVYGPGQLTMAATWNRYGTPGTVVGEDWPRTMAHELGHYLLYMWDNYIGLDNNGFVKLITTCTGTVMSDEYQDDDSELRAAPNWLTDCGETFSQKMVNRADWQTVKTFYPWFITTTVNAGPASLPLAVTQITFVDPVTPTTTLPDGRFYLSYNGGSYQPGPDALGWLFRGQQLFELGRPVVGQINARGARPGDRVCVIELSMGRAGCKTVVTNDNQSLALTSVISWTPDVRVTPVNSSTVRVNVYNLPNTYTMTARLYDDTGFATPITNVTWHTTTASYSATLVLTEPVVAGWIDFNSGAGREVVAVYTLGGNPTTKIQGGTTKIQGGTTKIQGGAPVLSGDGQAILYTSNLSFTQGEFYALQTATQLPSFPTWLTPVSKGYWVLKSAGAPSLSGASMSIGYAESDVPGGLETFVRMYFYTGTTWLPLTTTLDTNTNFAIAPSQGPGLYALMTAYAIPLEQGWNLVAYPVVASQTVTSALASITPTYKIVYGFTPSGGWKLFAPDVPPYVNTLTNLQFGYGYWISMTAPALLLLDVTPSLTAPEAVSSAEPPATFYGEVRANVGFTPQAGMSVEAWVDDQLCGQSQTLDWEGQVVYAIAVDACGALGQRVTFHVAGQSMANTGVWDNNTLHEMPLAISHLLYLPIIRH